MARVICPSPGAQLTIHDDTDINHKAIAAWLVQTCEAFGARTSTSYQVAGLFIKQLEQDDQSSGDSRDG